LDVNAEECVFIDDNFENVKSAGKVGINAIQFKSLGELRKELKKFI
jgi:putative hydrolase of the HAD superfamily